MASSSTSEVMLNDEDYRKLATNYFQEYALSELEDSLLWDAIKMDFENWTKENWRAINGNTWNIIKRCCIPRGVWIDHPGNNDTRAEILVKLVSTKYDEDLKDWNMDRIKQVERTHGKISRAIQLRKQELLGNIPDEPQTQQFQNIRFQTPPQQSAVEPLYPTLSKPSPYAYHPHQRQLPPKQDPLPQTFSHQTPQHQGQSLPQQQPFVSQDFCNQQNFCNQSDPWSQLYNQRRSYEQQQPAYRHQSIYGYQPTHGLQYAYGPQHAYENQYGTNDYQYVPNGPTSEIRDDCECIPEGLTAPTLLTQAPPIQAPPTKAPPTSAPSAPNKPDRGQPKKHPEQVNIVSPSNISFVMDKLDTFTNKDADAQPPQYTAYKQKEITGLLEKGVFKVVTPEKVPSNTRVFNSRFVNEIKDPCTDNAYEKSRLAYVQSTSDLNRYFYIRPPPELISLLGASSDFIIKVMKPLYGVPEAGNHWFATYHPHYKERLGMTKSTYDFCLYRSDPLGIVGMQTDDTLKQYVAQRARGAYIASVCQPETSFNFSRAAQTVEFSPDDIAPLNKRLQWQITNKSRGLRYAKLDQDTLQLVVFTDSSFANNKDLSSQIGYVICLADATNKVNIIHWSSIKCKRVTRSVLAAELYGMAHYATCPG